jgi:hypothetical protein
MTGIRWTLTGFPVSALASNTTIVPGWVVPIENDTGFE